MPISLPASSIHVLAVVVERLIPALDRVAAPQKSILRLITHWLLLCQIFTSIA